MAAMNISNNLPPHHPSEAIIPLRQWIQTEKCTNVKADEPFSMERNTDQTKTSLLRKTKVAYGIAELLRHAKRNELGSAEDKSEAPGRLFNGGSKDMSQEWCSLDNFAVRVSHMKEGAHQNNASYEILGMDMLSPRLSLNFTKRNLSNSHLSKRGSDLDEEDELGEDIKAKITGAAEKNNDSLTKEEMKLSGGMSVASSLDGEGGQQSGKLELDLDGMLESSKSGDALRKTQAGDDDSTMCRLFGPYDEIFEEDFFDGETGDNSDEEGNEADDSLLRHNFGILLYELFCNRHPFQIGTDSDNTIAEEMKETECTKEPARKKKFSESLSISERAKGSTATINTFGISLTPATSPEIEVSKCQSLHALGYPHSISLVVLHLLECGDGDFRSDNAYRSLIQASKDLHLLLKDPNLYLFHRHQTECLQSSEKATLHVRKKLYGREKEASIIAESYFRVTFSGENEALFISGYAGSGKTRLAMNFKRNVITTGGYFISQKFDQMSRQNPLPVVIAAFDSLCLMIKETIPSQEIQSISSELRASFGTSLSALARILPNICLIIPELRQPMPDDQQYDTRNLKGVRFLIQRFMKVVSSTSRPVVLFLDDLQWADETSFGLIYSILTETKGSNCLFFVGSYRDTEIEAGHALFQLINNLGTCHVLCTKLHLDGIERKSVNLMVSESLGIFPRISQSVSDIIFRKTKGSPLFIVEFLNLLVDKGLLRFSLRERRCLWDEDAINGLCVTDNVGDLLSAKMSILSTAMQSALKVASCFGIRVSSNIIACLSALDQYSNLEQDLEQLVKEGYMDKNESYYIFVHDKVRESSYGLIPVEQRHQFHLDLGMLLLDNFESSGSLKEDMVFQIADQINHCQLSLLGDAQRLKIAELNYKAGKRAMANSIFTAARYYGVVSSTLLPTGHWTSLYDLSQNIFLLLANAAFSCGLIDEASNALNSIINNSKCIEDKLDAYFMMTLLLQSCQETGKAYDLCANVLRLLGENIPTSVGAETLQTMMKVKQSLMGMSKDELLGVKEIDCLRHFLLVKFYSQACFLSFFAKPHMLQYFVCKIVEFSLEHGLCKYSSFGFALMATVLCSKMVNEPSLGYKVGKVAMSLATRRGAGDQLPRVLLAFHNFVSVRFEPLQSCVDMLHQGFQIGMSIGDTGSAFLCGGSKIQKSLICGSPLPELRNESDYYMKIFKDHSNSFSIAYMTLYKQTISTLINGNGSSEFDDIAADFASKNKAYSEVLLAHQAIQTFWLGHYERCQHIMEKIPDDVGRVDPFLILFFRGLVSLRLGKKLKKSVCHETAVNCINEMKIAAEHSSWNYSNKLFLIEAELCASEGNYAMAREKYDAAIQASSNSKFIHEQGLASEYAGIHYKNARDFDKALALFSRAKECYTAWGSQMKVDRVNDQIEQSRLNSKKSDNI